METLPTEMIEHILKNSTLSMTDIVNFSSTCSKFRELTNLSSTIWKSKYFQRWPKTDVCTTDWYNECIIRTKFEEKVFEILRFMSAKFYNFHVKNIRSVHLDFVVELLKSHKYGYYYLRDCLIAINSLPVSESLTNKYYARILLKFANKFHYTQVWKNLSELDVKEQTLEKGAIFVTHWCQENEQDILKTVVSELNYTADLVRQHLFHVHKDHPLKYVSKKTLLEWRNQNISGNMFEPLHCLQIIESINYVLFYQLKYYITFDLNNLDRKKCGIDYAVMDRRTTPLIFAVIYESIARRFGVRIEVLEFLDHCLLKWKESYGLKRSPYHYISMTNKGMFIKTRSCPRKSTANPCEIVPCDMQEIAKRAALHFYPRERGENHLSVRDVVELILVITPYSLEWYNQLYRTYTLQEMDVQEVITRLLTLKSQMSQIEWCSFQPLLHSLEIYQKVWEQENNATDRSPEVKNRKKNVKLAVGMIVRDKRFDNIGVIYGWDEVCRAPQWNEEVHSRRYPLQPFYKILVSNGSYQYVGEDNLQILHSPPFISHPFIGQFFEEYCTTYYKPNKELQAEYPDDLEALLVILKKDREAET